MDRNVIDPESRMRSAILLEEPDSRWGFIKYIQCKNLTCRIFMKRIPVNIKNEHLLRVILDSSLSFFPLHVLNTYRYDSKFWKFCFPLILYMFNCLISSSCLSVAFVHCLWYKLFLSKVICSGFDSQFEKYKFTVDSKLPYFQWVE